MIRRREVECWLLIVLIASTAFVDAKHIPKPQKSSHNLKVSRTTRQADDFGSITSLISLGIKYAPLLIKTFNTFSGAATAATSAVAESTTKASTQVDRVDPPAAAAAAADPFSWSNLLSVGIKVALALVSSYTSDGIDKSDAISPTQAVIGTVLGALTGSEDPKEVAFFAKQGDEVIGLVVSLVEAIYTSVTS